MSTHGPEKAMSRQPLFTEPPVAAADTPLLLTISLLPAVCRLVVTLGLPLMGGYAAGFRASEPISPSFALPTPRLPCGCSLAAIAAHARSDASVSKECVAILTEPSHLGGRRKRPG